VPNVANPMMPLPMSLNSELVHWQLPCVETVLVRQRNGSVVCSTAVSDKWSKVSFHSAQVMDEQEGC